MRRNIRTVTVSSLCLRCGTVEALRIVAEKNREIAGRE